MVSSVEKGIKFQNEVEVYFKKLLALKNKQNKNGFGSVKNRSNAPGHDIIVTFRNFGYNKNLKIIIHLTTYNNIIYIILLIILKER